MSGIPPFDDRAPQQRPHTAPPLEIPTQCDRILIAIKRWHLLDIKPSTRDAILHLLLRPSFEASSGGASNSDSTAPLSLSLFPRLYSRCTRSPYVLRMYRKRTTIITPQLDQSPRRILLLLRVLFSHMFWRAVERDGAWGWDRDGKTGNVGRRTGA